MDSYKRTYSMVDIAGKLGRPRSTVKEWAAIFQEFLPTVGQGRNTRYREDALEIFNLIARLRDEKQPNDHIRDILRGIVKEITVVAENDNTPFLEKIIEGYAVLYEEMQSLNNQNKALLERLEGMDQREQERMKRETEHGEALAELNKNLQEVSTTLSRVETYGKKSIWARLFSK